MSVLNLIFAIFLPPVGAYLQVGLTTHFWINLALTLAGYIPGVIHAIWLVPLDKKAADIRVGLNRLNRAVPLRKIGQQLQSRGVTFLRVKLRTK